MDKRAVIVFLLVLLVVVSSGCQLGSLTGKKVNQQQTDISESAYKGTKGLSMGFVRNSPPKIMYTNTPLSILVEIKNEGASNIRGGRLYISGLDPNIVRLDSTYKLFNLDGKTRYTTTGGIDNIEFHSSNIYLPGGTDVYKPTILASACYEYITKATPLVCINPNPYSALEKSSCEVKTVSLTGGQGAPVAVTSVQEEAMPGRVNFIINVENQKTEGTVIDRTGYGMNRCPSDLQYADLDVVYYTVSLAGQIGDCKPTNKIKLSDGRGVIACSFQLPTSGGQSAYQTVLNIDLSYGYLSQISQQIEIRSMG